MIVKVKNVVMNDFALNFRLKEYLFGKKKSKSLRPGAIPPEKLKEIVEKIGVDKKIKIRRIDVMGGVEERPVEAILVGIFDDHFAVKVVNPERKLMEAMNTKTIYVKGGGGVIDFYYEDGDIKEIIEDVDEKIISEIDKESVVEIINALDLGDEIRISYFDHEDKTAVNCIGSMLKKFSDEHFIILAKQINSVELDDPHEIELDINKSPILDIQIT
jgi:hypothetical protein